MTLMRHPLITAGALEVPALLHAWLRQSKLCPRAGRAECVTALRYAHLIVCLDRQRYLAIKGNCSALLH